MSVDEVRRMRRGWVDALRRTLAATVREIANAADALAYAGDGVATIDDIVSHLRGLVERGPLYLPPMTPGRTGGLEPDQTDALPAHKREAMLAAAMLPSPGPLAVLLARTLLATAREVAEAAVEVRTAASLRIAAAAEDIDADAHAHAEAHAEACQEAHQEFAAEIAKIDDRLALEGDADASAVHTADEYDANADADVYADAYAKAHQEFADEFAKIVAAEAADLRGFAAHLDGIADRRAPGWRAAAGDVAAWLRSVRDPRADSSKGWVVVVGDVAAGQGADSVLGAGGSLAAAIRDAWARGGLGGGYCWPLDRDGWAAVRCPGCLRPVDRPRALGGCDVEACRAICRSWGCGRKGNEPRPGAHWCDGARAEGAVHRVEVALHDRCPTGCGGRLSIWASPSERGAVVECDGCGDVAAIRDALGAAGREVRGCRPPRRAPVELPPDGLPF